MAAWVVLSLPAVSGGDAAKNSQGHAAVFHDNGVFPGSALFHATAVNDVCLGHRAVQRHAVIQSVPLTALAAVDISYGSAADGNCVPDNMRIYRAAVATRTFASFRNQNRRWRRRFRLRFPLQRRSRHRRCLILNRNRRWRRCCRSRHHCWLRPGISPPTEPPDRMTVLLLTGLNTASTSLP